MNYFCLLFMFFCGKYKTKKVFLLKQKCSRDQFLDNSKNAAFALYIKTLVLIPKDTLMGEEKKKQNSVHHSSTPHRTGDPDLRKPLLQKALMLGGGGPDLPAFFI